MMRRPDSSRLPILFLDSQRLDWMPGYGTAHAIGDRSNDGQAARPGPGMTYRGQSWADEGRCHLVLPSRGS